MPSDRLVGGDVEHVLTALLHDLRTPLGVAHGYLRLVREGRLPTEDDRTQALDKTRDALGRMTQLCNDATAAASRAGSPADATMPVDEFVQAVRKRLQLDGHRLDSGDTPLAGTVRLHADAPLLVDTVAGMLRASSQTRPGVACRAETRSAHLSFVCGGSSAADDDVVVVSIPLETEPA